MLFLDMDVGLFRWINSWPDALSPIFVFFSEATKNPWMRVALILFFIALLFRPKLRVAAIIAALAWPIANLLCDVLKSATEMQRPCVELPDVVLRVKQLTSFGMPSAHSANMACVAAVFLCLARPWGIAWVIVAMLTGLSRIYVGVHYPSQVLAGWMLGAMVGYLGVLLYRRITRNRTSEEHPELP